MKKWIWTIIVASFLCGASAGSGWAQPVTLAEAETVAENWIRTIIDKRGSWGTAQEAQIEDIQEFKRKGRPVGYFCRVRPNGYIIVSPRKEMVPVYAFSTKSDLDPKSEEGMADLIKGKMESVFDWIQNIASERKAVTGEEVADTLETDHRPTWDALMKNPEGFPLKPQKDGAQSDALEKAPSDADSDTGSEDPSYLKEGVRLSSNYYPHDELFDSPWQRPRWHQRPPYNNDCPLRDPDNKPYSCTTSNTRPLVGCTATAAAQIMYYWGWPPTGKRVEDPPWIYILADGPYDDEYDWHNMRDEVTKNSPPEQQAAVAELCHEIGQAIHMDYGCDGSGAYETIMAQAYRVIFRFPQVDHSKRSPFDFVENWFSDLKNELDHNRPVLYRITNHVMVADGYYQEMTSPNDVLRYVHMVYGHNDPAEDMWWPLDDLEGEMFDEAMITGIYPESSLNSITGTFTRQAFPYRYFYMDTTGGPGTFEGGQRIQFLPGMVLKCTSGTVTFKGSASEYSHLFSRGDLRIGLRIHKQANAAVKLYPNGSIRFN